MANRFLGGTFPTKPEAEAMRLLLGIKNTTLKFIKGTGWIVRRKR